MGLTVDRNDPLLSTHLPSGQQANYLVLSEDERAKGFVRPVREIYRHLACGISTRMDRSIAETYARDPKFYGGTFCCRCGEHFRLIDAAGKPAFTWEPDGSPVGS